MPLPALRISGSGTFYGAIICEGDVFVEGTPTIQYDEAAIARAVLLYPQVKAFFAPGEQGAASHVRVMRVAQGAKKVSGERFELVSWLEWQE